MLNVTPTDDNSGLRRDWARKLAGDLSKLWEREDDVDRLFFGTVPLLKDAREHLAGGPDDRTQAQFQELLGAVLAAGEDILAGADDPELGRVWIQRLDSLTRWLDVFVTSPSPPGSERLQ
jgi:hypothetical protein